jgi:paraquat-inducible protein B
MESVVTGKNFVALDYYPQDSERYFRDIDKLKYQQMPSMTTDLDEFIANVDSAVRGFSQIDFDGLSSSIKKALNKFSHALDDADLQRVSASFSEACNGVSKLVNGQEVKNILSDVGAVARRFNLRFDGVADDFSGALAGIREILGDDSSFKYNLETSLVQLERMLRSLHECLDFLERNPNAIFAGKDL